MTTCFKIDYESKHVYTITEYEIKAPSLMWNLIGKNC